MKTILTVMMIFTLLGCNADKASHTLSDNVDKVLIASSGNQAPKFFAFASPYRANGYVMQHKDYSFTMLLTKESDWGKMSGWHGAYIYGGIGISLGNFDESKIGKYIGYGINISSSVGTYGEMQKAIENKNINYIRSHIRIDSSDKLAVKYCGKENYPCEVMEYTKKNYPKNKFIGYACYKFNPAHTKYKSVNIKLIYTKSPNLPAKYKSLAKQYTYQDLQNRAKRTLDSLYIKDGW